MTKLSQEQKELKAQQLENKKSFEREIREEYRDIQLEAEGLKREVELCYKQLHRLQ